MFATRRVTQITEQLWGVQVRTLCPIDSTKLPTYEVKQVEEDWALYNVMAGKLLRRANAENM